MEQNNTTQPPFSLIADFEGDVEELFRPVREQTLPVLPLRGTVLFPGVVTSIMVSRESSRRLIAHVEETGGVMVIGFQKDASVEEPTLADLYPLGVAARVMRVMPLPDGNSTAFVQTLGRAVIGKLFRQRPFLRAYVTSLEEVLPEAGDEEFKALAAACLENTVRYLKLAEGARSEAAFAVKNISSPIIMVNFVLTNLPFATEEKMTMLQEGELKKRAYMLMNVLSRECQLASLKRKIQDKTREDLDQKQKEYFLQQQLKNIQDELGEAEADDVASLREKAKSLKLPPKVKELFERELRRLERYNSQSPDYSMELTYLQTLAGLPWGKETEDNLNISHAQRTLDRRHYGMEKVKERILEHLAVLKLRGDMKAPILCLYGPPGVGKTSLGRSIAEALGREYVRVSLGGIHDEAEIRGHRRTYIGAMPGRIIKGLQRAGTDNPVFVLDEIDKVSENNYNGDPQSALLEVLDPEQNKAFHDNYLDTDYDLSHVLFIATANSLQGVPAPLLDRMELIPVEGYSVEEKREIARRHLIPRLEEELGLKQHGAPKLTARALDFLIDKYTRESGVRQLEKQLGNVFRKVALQTARAGGAAPDKAEPLTPKDVEALLGKPLFAHDRYQGNDYAGVVTGLAWTSAGGEILFIETSLSRSKAPKLTLTGNLGDVMKESAMLALSYLKSHADLLGLDYRVFEEWGVHVHVPEGATPKDGPSAGITIATSLASALTQRKVRPHVAMTGEITLRGRVLPVGGIKEKILAAKRAGITDIVISTDNRRDVEEIPAAYRHGLTFHYVKDVAEVLAFALLPEKVAHPQDITVTGADAK